MTPLNPAKWFYVREGATVTLTPSIGNLSFPCKSHYLIIKNEVVWARSMSAQRIANVKARDARDQAAYIARTNLSKSKAAMQSHSLEEKQLPSWLSQLVAALRRWWQILK